MQKKSLLIMFVVSLCHSVSLSHSVAALFCSRIEARFLFQNFIRQRFSEIEISVKLPRNDPEGTKMTQGDNKYGEKVLFVYFIPDFYVFIPIQSI